MSKRYSKNHPSVRSWRKRYMMPQAPVAPHQRPEDEPALGISDEDLAFAMRVFTEQMKRGQI